MNGAPLVRSDGEEVQGLPVRPRELEVDQGAVVPELGEQEEGELRGEGVGLVVEGVAQADARPDDLPDLDGGSLLPEVLLSDDGGPGQTPRRHVVHPRRGRRPRVVLPGGDLRPGVDHVEGGVDGDHDDHGHQDAQHDAARDARLRAEGVAEGLLESDLGGRRRHASSPASPSPGDPGTRRSCPGRTPSPPGAWRRGPSGR